MLDNFVSHTIHRDKSVTDGRRRVKEGVDVREGVRIALRVMPKSSPAGVAGIRLDAAGIAYLQVRVNAPADSRTCVTLPGTASTPSV